MAIQHIHNVRIKGISAAVPKNIMETRSCPAFASGADAEKYVDSVGCSTVHLAPPSLCCSDMCQAAAEKLMQKLGWERESIDAMVFVSQSQDYILPATACVLHGKMGLREECLCFDISLGCSGWVYGLSALAPMLQAGGIKRALLLSGDVPSKPERPLFGDSGTATALEYDETATVMNICTRTDGGKYEAIIRRSGGTRAPFDEHSLDIITDQFGHRHRPIDTEMDGTAVFVFGITKVPKAVKHMLALTSKTVEDVDYFLFHQANLMMNEQIRKKCKIPVEKCPYSLHDFGNNSSASIPLTMVTQIAGDLQARDTEIVACGFGVGLSWGTLSVKLQKPVVLPLILI